MAKNTDIACLFILLNEAGIRWEFDVDDKISQIWYYFPERDETRLKTLCKKLIEQLQHPELQQIHAKTFRALSFDQRYKIGIDAVANLCSGNNTLENWYRAYSSASDKWFAKDELSEVKRKIKASIDVIRTKGKSTLGYGNQQWWQWENVKDNLILREHHWEDPYDAFSVWCIIGNDSLWFTLYLQANAGEVHAVTKPEVCLWGVSDDLCIAKALNNGIFKYVDSSYVPHPEKEKIAAELLKKYSITYFSSPIKDNWMKEMLDLSLDEVKTSTSTNSDPVPKPKSKPGSKSITTIQRSLEKEWLSFYEELSKVYYTTNITDQAGKIYPIICNYQNRKATAKKNLKTITAHITKIEAILSEYKESFINISSIDEAFETLCSISHEIQTLNICLESLENKYGCKYKVTSDTAKMMSSCERHYVTLLSDSARNTLRSMDELKSANKKLVQQIKSVTNHIETYRADVAATKKKLERCEQAWRAAQKASQTNTDVLKAEADKLEATLSNLSTSITRSEESRTTNEDSLTAAKKQQGELQERQHTLQREYDQFVEANERTSRDLQRQLQEAEAVLQKTLMFKKNKQQRVDELKAALTRHQETVRTRMDCLEKEISSLRDSCSALRTRITQLATASSKAEARLSQLFKDKARIQHQLEDKKNALIMLERDSNTAQNAFDTCGEELKKLEGLLAASIKEQTHCNDELTKNQRELASLDEPFLQKILIYPKKYGKAAPHVSAVATSNFAFTRRLTAEFAKASKSFADISKLTYQHMHLSASIEAFHTLQEEKLVGKDTDLAPVIGEFEIIKEKICHLKDEAKRYCAPFVPVDASTIAESKNATFVKKANMLFEALWSQIADGTVLPAALSYQLNAANCLQVSDGYYLCFTPFYIIALDLKKSKHVSMELLRYTDITFELEEPQVSLDYEKECPTGATVIAKHWKHETVAGAANRRYTNNPSYLVVALNAVKLVCAKRTKTIFLLSFEEAQRTIQAFCDLRDFLHEENADLMNRVFAENQIPNVVKIVSEIAEEREKAESERKEQERRMQQQELALKQQREEEKRQKEQHQKHLEQWADSAQKSKAEDDLLVAKHMELLPPITPDQIANWDDQLCQPVAVTDRRRVITNGITKIEFLHQNEVKGMTKFLAYFADANGKVFSDIRTLPSAPLGTKKVIPFEMKTQSESNPPKLYMLIRSMEDGQLVGKIEYELNIAFTNDFDF